MAVRTRCTGTKITLADGQEFLIVEIAIDCPACGQITIRLAGHHLRAIRDALIELIDLHPGVTGKDGDVHVIERIRVAGEIPDDPTRN